MEQDGNTTSSSSRAWRAMGNPTREALEGLVHVLDIAVNLLQGNDVGLVHHFREVLELLAVLVGGGVLRECEAPAIPRCEAQRGQVMAREAQS